MSETTFNVAGTVQMKAILSDGRVKASPGQSLKIDIEGFKYDIGGRRGTYLGAVSQSVTDDTTSRVYLDSTGTLQIKTTAQQADFPTEAHIPLARIVAANGEIAQIYVETVLLASSSSDIGLCKISYPVDGDIRGGDTSASSNNDFAAVRFDTGSTEGNEPRNRWNRRPPQNYTSGNVALRLVCSVGSSIGSSTSTRWEWSWAFRNTGEALGTWDDSNDQTIDVSNQTYDELFELKLTMPAATMLAGMAKEQMFLKLVRWSSDTTNDNCGQHIYVHNIHMEYTGRRAAGQPGQ